MSLRILATGGTFDKKYDPLSGTMSFGASHIPEIITRARITLPVVIEQLFLLDSLEMTEPDRQRVLAACQTASEGGIVVIHGTDTMRETAEVLGAAKLAKTIVLTGAMIPYDIADSDALFNFGFACCAAQTLPHGVVIAMNGQIFPWSDVQKIRSAGVFAPR